MKVSGYIKNILIISISVLVLFFASCCKKQSISSVDDSSMSSADLINIENMISIGEFPLYSISPEEQVAVLNQWSCETDQEDATPSSFLIKYYSSPSQLSDALLNDEISYLKLPFTFATYLILQNKDFVQFRSCRESSISFSMAMLKKNKVLCDQISSAINMLIDTEMLTSIVQDSILRVFDGAEPQKYSSFISSNFDTIKIGVTGGIPPLDFFDSAGVPTGFSTHLSSEIGLLINKNIELVPIDITERQSALASEKVDALFWVISTNEGTDEIYDEIKDTTDVIKTTPYFFDKVFMVKKEGLRNNLNLTGELSLLNISEKKLKESLGTIREKDYFSNLTEMLTALEKREIDAGFLPAMTASFLAIQKPQFQIANASGETISLSMALSSDNKNLAAKINSALFSMRQDGVLNLLISKANYLAPSNFSSAPLPYIPGAPSITVAVTGDLPPIDFIDENGNPAGFSMALLKEIAERITVNFSVININSGERADVLKSKKADIVFWGISNFVIRGENGGSIFTEMDRGEDLLFTDAYLINTRMMFEPK